MEYGAKGREPAAEGGPSLARKGVWGGREPGAEGSLGQKGVWGGRKSDLHNHQAIVQPRRNHQAIVQPRLYDWLPASVSDRYANHCSNLNGKSPTPGLLLLCHGNFGSPQWPALGSVCVYSVPERTGKAPVAVTLKGPLAARARPGPAALGAFSFQLAQSHGTGRFGPLEPR